MTRGWMTDEERAAWLMRRRVGPRWLEADGQRRAPTPHPYDQHYDRLREKHGADFVEAVKRSERDERPRMRLAWYPERKADLPTAVGDDVTPKR